VEDVCRLHRSEQGMSEGCLSTVEHALSRWCLGKQVVEFFGCLLGLQPYQYASERQAEDSAHDGWSQLLLRGNVIRAEERWGDIPEAYGQSFQRPHRAECWGLCGWCGCKVWIS